MSTFLPPSTNYLNQEEIKTLPDSQRIYFGLRNGNCSIPTEEDVKKETKRMGLDSINMEPFIPTGIVRMQMEPELVQFLQSNDIFATPSVEPNSDEIDDYFESRGYSGPLIDGPQMRKTHIYHEGYYHASASSILRQQTASTSTSATTSTTEPTTELVVAENNNKDRTNIDCPIDSMNPRYGCPMSKPAAPRSFRAFLFAFKKINEKWINELIAKLNLPFLTFDTIFADVAAQSHYGTEVKISPDAPGGWHWDAPNSIIHLAVSLHGKRYLHFQHHVPAEQKNEAGEEPKRLEEEQEEDSSRSSSQEKKSKDWAADRYCRVENTAGCAYLTSPSAFKHAVEYPECGFPTRILAIQCRTLLDTKNSYRDLFGKVDWAAKDKIVGEMLRNEPNIRLPTMAEVVEVLVEMERFHGKEQHDDDDVSSTTNEADSSPSKCVIA